MCQITPLPVRLFWSDRNSWVKGEQDMGNRSTTNARKASATEKERHGRFVALKLFFCLIFFAFVSLCGRGQSRHSIAIRALLVASKQLVTSDTNPSNLGVTDS
ncbi:uncharacterized protein BDW43DRAFT_275274 [Aspergillus alliaceus]|uniref:uncharacterized protein n=1 Tax=Petromyces alliaceus TaxID=209559 RepID=UPI0012A539D0|nr:uncharacterized protein BDW43DRAFT_275274 [Aspergillus alliaceus]KAB8233842.1 hypothetical protein BDW43DRAFT_275274 [Aspergillus alliaceus]